MLPLGAHAGGAASRTRCARSLGRFDDVVIKPTFSDGYAEPIFTAALLDRRARRRCSPANPRAPARTTWRRSTCAPSTTPLLTDGELDAARRWSCAAYAVADGAARLPRRCPAA